MESAPHLLIVDDHQEIRELVARFMTRHGFRVSAAGDGREMWKILDQSRIDIVILDLMLPGTDGLALCRELRVKSNVPVIMLTALGEETDRIIGLEMGADDYVSKPFNPRELLARVKAVIRRAQSLPEQSAQSNGGELTFATWCLDTARRELTSAEGVVVPLSTGEFSLLMTFVQHPRRVLTRDQLLDLARGRGATAFDRSIDTQVSRLRRKIEIDPKNPQIIKTVWGDGYMFMPTVERK